MRIEVLTSPGCLNAERARQLLTVSQAKPASNEPILGLVSNYQPSPTVLINGVDVMPPHGA